MNVLNKTSLIIIGAALTVILILAGAWFFFFRSSSTPQTGSSVNFFGTPTDNNNSGSNNTDSQSEEQITNVPTTQTSENKIFQISAGPVVGATLIQILHPTTTLARYIMQENGHVFDLPLDVAGAVPRVVSNVTIPGGQRAIWLEQGNAAIMQYIDGNTTKSVYLGFPIATTTNAAATLPTRIVFLPDSIVDIAPSPDGASVLYMLKTSAGVDGYTAKSDGTGAKKLFSLPLSQVLISWPAQGTLLAQSKPAAGVPGIVFSIDVKSGAVTPLIYGNGITALANKNFSKIIYQTYDSSSVSSYLRDIARGTNNPLPSTPYPERCTWGTATTTLYCASPTNTASSNYLDGWHVGTMSTYDSIFKLDFSALTNSTIAIPGISGGVQSDILEMALSPNEKYLSFTTKGGRSVWGVRLSP